MRMINGFAGIVLLLTSALASAQPPYVIHGLHTALTLAQARAQAEKLGGVCREAPARPNAADRNVQCAFRQCDEAVRSQNCAEGELPGTGLVFASHPILSIGFTAAGDAAAVNQIVMVYEGDAESVAGDLIATFGETEAEGSPTDNASWTHARRWSWRQGVHRMGLMDAPQLIILSRDVLPPATDSAEVAH